MVDKFWHCFYKPGPFSLSLIRIWYQLVHLQQTSEKQRLQKPWKLRKSYTKKQPMPSVLHEISRVTTKFECFWIQVKRTQGTYFWTKNRRNREISHAIIWMKRKTESTIFLCKKMTDNLNFICITGLWNLVFLQRNRIYRS